MLFIEFRLFCLNIVFHQPLPRGMVEVDFIDFKVSGSKSLYEGSLWWEVGLDLIC